MFSINMICCCTQTRRVVTPLQHQNRKVLKYFYCCFVPTVSFVIFLLWLLSSWDWEQMKKGKMTPLPPASWYLEDWQGLDLMAPSLRVRPGWTRWDYYKVSDLLQLQYCDQDKAPGMTSQTPYVAPPGWWVKLVTGTFLFYRCGQITSHTPFWL